MDIYYLEKIFLLFLFCSFFGWTVETIGEYIKSKKFVNRGFLIGPICPVYGIGVLIITVCLSRYEDDIFAIFGLSAILCGVLEYFTSYFMEKVFNARWWDYSNIRFNINGRICLQNLVLFAIAGVFLIKLFNPFFFGIIDSIPREVVDIITYTCLGILIIDIIVSFVIINKIKKITNTIKNENKDSTEYISKKVRDTISQKSMAYRRVIEAFPHVFADKVKNSKEKIIKAAENVKEKTKENIDIAKQKTRENIDIAKQNIIETSINNKIRMRRIKRKISRSRIMTISIKKNKTGEK